MEAFVTVFSISAAIGWTYYFYKWMKENLDEKRRLKIVMFTLWCLGISLFLLAAIYDVGYLLTDSGYPKPGDGQLGM